MSIGMYFAVDKPCATALVPKETFPLWAWAPDALGCP